MRMTQNKDICTVQSKTRMTKVHITFSLLVSPRHDTLIQMRLSFATETMINDDQEMR